MGLWCYLLLICLNVFSKIRFDGILILCVEFHLELIIGGVFLDNFSFGWVYVMSCY